MDGTRLRPGVDTMTVTEIASGRERAAGLAISTVRPKGTDGLEMVYRMRDPAGQEVVVTTQLDRRSLLPVNEARRYPDGEVVALHYGPEGVSGEATSPGAAPRPIPTDPAAREAYSSTAVDLVLRSLPLAAGFRTDLPVYMPAPLGRVTLPVRVVGEEVVRTRAGAGVDCWRVEADFPGPATERFWIAKSSGALVRVVGHAGPDVLQRYDR